MSRGVGGGRAAGASVVLVTYCGRGLGLSGGSSGSAGPGWPVVCVWVLPVAVRLAGSDTVVAAGRS